jgi:pimeloyl-ACP methyl ester carboxylesterase
MFEENLFTLNTKKARNGNLLYATTHGEGTPVILIHGVAASHHDWNALIPDLVDSGYQAHAVDLLGHGDSAQPGDPQLYTAKTLYKVLEDWIQSMDLQSPFILIGHSLGGHLSLRYALRHSDKVRGMVLISPFYTRQQLSPLVHWINRRPEWGKKLLDVVPQNLVDSLLGWDPIDASSFTAQARLQVVVDIKRASPHVLDIPRTIPDLTPDLGRIRVPSKVIWGTKDLTLKPDTFPPLVVNMPTASGQALPGSGHQPHIGVPEKVNQTILDFLNGL